MKKFNKLIGNFGEELAISILKENRHDIIESNFQTRTGEIDIISFDKNILVFTEVKTRTNKLYGKAFESISYSKMKNIIKTSKQYIHYKNLYNYFVRYDVVEVEVNSTTNKISTNYIKDAFREN